MQTNPQKLEHQKYNWKKTEICKKKKKIIQTDGYFKFYRTNGKRNQKNGWKSKAWKKKTCVTLESFVFIGFILHFFLYIADN